MAWDIQVWALQPFGLESCASLIRFAWLMSTYVVKGKRSTERAWPKASVLVGAVSQILHVTLGPQLEAGSPKAPNEACVRNELAISSHVCISLVSQLPCLCIFDPLVYPSAFVPISCSAYVSVPFHEAPPLRCSDLPYPWPCLLLLLAWTSPRQGTFSLILSSLCPCCLPS